MSAVVLLTAGVVGLAAATAVGLAAAFRDNGRPSTGSRRPLAVVVARELERSRRFGHPLGVVAVRADRQRLRRPGRHADWRRQARRTDHLVVIGDRLYVVCPETDRDDARALVERLVWALGAEHVDTATAVSFPADGLTVRALLASLSDAEVAARGRARTAAA